MTSKQRAYLKSLAMTMDPIFQIGKDGISENFVKQISDALEARELIKIHILESSFLDARDTVNELARLTQAEAVQAIGSKIVLYRESRNKKQIELPKK